MWISFSRTVVLLMTSATPRSYQYGSGRGKDRLKTALA
jgi:hypothetical protein